MLDEPWKRLLAVLTPLVLVGLYVCWQCVVLMVAIGTALLLVLWITEGSIF